MKKETKGLVTAGTFAAVILGSTVLLSSGNRGSGDEWSGGGGSLGGGGGGGFDWGGLLEEIQATNENFFPPEEPAPIFEFFEESSLLNEPPNFPDTVAPILTPTPPTSGGGGGFWDAVKTALNPQTVQKATTASLFAVNPIAGLGFAAGSALGQSAGVKLADRLNIGGSSGSGGSSGTGSARIVDTRTESGAAAMAGASHIKIHKNQYGKTKGTVTVW